MILNEDNYQAILLHVLKTALSKKADEAEVFIAIDRSLNFSIEKNHVESVNQHEENGLGIRVIKDSRIGFAYTTNITDRNRIETTVEKAIKLSKLSNEEKNFSFPSDKPNKNIIPRTYDKKISEIGPDECLEIISQAIDAAHETDRDIVVSGGGLNIGENITIIANTNDIFVENKSTFLSLGISTLLKKQEATSGFEIIESKTLDNINPHAVGEKAARLAKDMQGSKKAEDRKVEAIFMPYAFISLIEGTIIPALYADKAHKNATMFSNKLGKVVTDENLTIYDNPLMEGGLNSSPVDDELTPSKKTMLIENGLLKKYLYDQKTACKYNKESTSNGIRIGSFKSLPSICARNIVIRGKDEHTQEEIIEDTKKGILVYDVLGAHTSDPASGNFSVASSILFKIENGKIVYPIKKAMLSGNILGLLRRNVETCDNYKMLGGSMSAMAAYLPTVKVKDIKITQ